MYRNLDRAPFIERRGKPRIICDYAAMVSGFDAQGKKYAEPGRVINLSASGLYVVLNLAIKNGEELSLRVAVPTGVLELGTSKLAIKGIVVRSEPQTDGVFGVAIKLSHYRFL